MESSKETKMHNAGFTLIEILLSTAIITLLAGLSLPIYASFQTRNDLDIATESIADMLRRAETYARSVNGDSQWGVEIQPGVATLFKGTSFATHTTAFDETTTIPSSITASGVSEIFFSKFSALPTTTGTITLTVDANNARTITINGKGMVTY